jgi:hypothetical protein
MSALIQPNGLPIITPGEPLVTCQCCGIAQSRRAIAENEYRCPYSEEMVCLTCGCSDRSPCFAPSPCRWVSLGRCSACEAELMAAVRELWPQLVQTEERHESKNQRH